MIKPGQVVLFRFPHADLSGGKLRPAVTICRIPGKFDDWLICMVSSQLYQAVVGFDNIIKASDADFQQSGLKVDSVIRVGRLAVVSQASLLGAIGNISVERLSKVKDSMTDWIQGK